MAAAILALDYGTTALKAALYDERLNCLGVTSREWVYLYPAQSFIEHPVEAYWEKTVSAVNELLDRFGGRESLRAVSVTGQAETLIALDDRDAPLGDAIVWLDTRAGEECEWLTARYPAEKLYAATGNTGFDPVMPVCKLMWMRHHQPERYARTRMFLLLKEYIVYRLSGVQVGEYSAQSCSGYFDINRCDWVSDLLELADIDPRRLPPLRDSQYIPGPVCPEARAATGLPEGVQVVNGLLDQCASVIGAGAVDETQITETTGTVLAIGATLSSFDGSTPDMLVLRHGLKDRYLALPNCSTAGVLLKWFRDQFTPAGTDFDDINRQILARGRRESGLLLLPHFAGYLSPVNNPQATGVLYGLSLDTAACDVAHAIMEGVGFLLKENLALLARRGIRAPQIVSLGGGAKSPLWLGIKAAICNCDMVTLADSESTAFGCAVNAALALQMIRMGDVLGLARIQSRHAPDPALVEVYDAKYQSYLALNRRLGFNPPGEVVPPKGP